MRLILKIWAVPSKTPWKKSAAKTKLTSAVGEKRFLQSLEFSLLRMLMRWRHWVSLNIFWSDDISNAFREQTNLYNTKQSGSCLNTNKEEAENNSLGYSC